MPKPAVVLQPVAAAELKSGFDELADLLALTLGPTQGAILNAPDRTAAPELLTDAATIARRVLALPDRRRDVGAMLLRQLVWRVHQQVGDGAARTAVLAQAILREATRVVAAGANPVAVQRGIRQATTAALAALTAQARPARDDADLAAVALAVTGLPVLSQVLGELFDLLGPQAHIALQDHVAPYLERTYLDGGRWPARLVSPYFVTAPASQRAIQPDCSVVLYQGRVQTAADVIPLLNHMEAPNRSPLLLVAEEISGEAVTILVANHTAPKSGLQLVAVALELGGERAAAHLADLNLITGATILGPSLGRRLTDIGPADLGRARRVEADRQHLVVAGGHGLAEARRAEIQRLEHRLRQTPAGDPERDELQARLGRLAGSAAILKLGAATRAEREVLRQKAEQGLRALEATLHGGYADGGGRAFTLCRAGLEALTYASEDEKLGGEAVARALTAPFFRLLNNAGVAAPAVILDELERRPGGTVYNVLTRRFEPARDAGIVDPVPVLTMSLETAASGAVMALSVSAMVLKRRPRLSYEP